MPRSRLRRIATLLFAAILLTPTGLALAQDDGAASEEEFWSSFDWRKGPTKGALGRIASIDVPEGYIFADDGTSQELMQQMGNFLSDQEVGLIAPEGFVRKEAPNWFIIFEFDPGGYVEDDDEDLDADDLLETLMEGNRQGNEQRRAEGLPTLTIRGWKIAPRYDPVTNNLEWATDLVAESGEPLVNHNIRLLGRRGVMSATIVADDAEFESALTTAKQLLTGYSYISGERYSEYRSGDKIWKGGLAALVAGGAVAAAAKSGLLKHLWKIIVVVGAAIAGFFKKIFGGGKKKAYRRTVRRNSFGDREPPVE